jgi:AcrR family transcriptional regulator
MSRSGEAVEVKASAPPQGRKPAQRRSRERVEALLDAAASLLENQEIAAVSLYDVARLAGIPPGSVYHFFPTKESVLYALAQRFHREMHADLDAEIEGGEIDSWQSLITLRYRCVVRYFNERPAARRLFMGAGVSPEIKKLDVADIQTIAADSYADFDRYLHMPYILNPELRFTVLIGIYDGVWAASYAEHGYITEDYAREGLAAALAYCETFLPKVVPLRQPAAASRP